MVCQCVQQTFSQQSGTTNDLIDFESKLRAAHLQIKDPDSLFTPVEKLCGEISGSVLCQMKLQHESAGMGT